MMNLERDTYPKTVVEKAVNDRVNAAVGHGEPVNCVVKTVEEFLLGRGHDLCNAGSEVQEEEEDVEWQPADTEEEHHHAEHLNHLQGQTVKVLEVMTGLVWGSWQAFSQILSEEQISIQGKNCSTINRCCMKQGNVESPRMSYDICDTLAIWKASFADTMI